MDSGDGDSLDYDSLSRGGIINRGLTTGEAEYEQESAVGPLIAAYARSPAHDVDSSPSSPPLASSFSSFMSAENKKKGGTPNQKDVLVSVDSDSDSQDDDDDFESPAAGDRKSQSVQRSQSSKAVVDGVVLNPLTSILNNSELLDFVTGPISPHQTFQCTIMRDKRGIDRSLYPTYFMYLQGMSA